MNKETKAKLVAELTEKFNDSTFLYVVDTSNLSALETTTLRRMLHKNGVKMQVAKNTLIKRAMDESERDFGELVDTLKGVSALMFTSEVKAPAQVISNLRKKGDKPVLKGAYIDNDLFIGDDKLGALTELKSKEDLIAEVIGLLQSPAKNVVSALQSSGGKLAGILKTLEEK
jgi:large subunit ribosomal protein L10